MSGFERYLRSVLEHANPRWAREFDTLLGDEEVRGALEQIRKGGGDPNFALFVLAQCRWRRVRTLPALGQRERLLQAIKLLREGEGEWPERLRAFAQDDWKTIDDVLRRGAQFLGSFPHINETLFETRGTRYETETPRFRSDHISIGLLVLDWHIRKAEGKTRSDRVVLGRLFDAFGMIRRSDPESSSERWVEKRLERASKEDADHQSLREYVEKFVVAPLHLLYHSVHGAAGVPCGISCRPFERKFRAEDQERLLVDAQEASLMASGDHQEEALEAYKEALRRGEELLGPTHVGLVHILHGCADALRATGQTEPATVMDERVTAILTRYGKKLEDLTGFQPGGGPDGDLQPVWRNHST
jgi:hypothetical protein